MLICSALQLKKKAKNNKGQLNGKLLANHDLVTPDDTQRVRAELTERLNAGHVAAWNKLAKLLTMNTGQRT